MTPHRPRSDPALLGALSLLACPPMLDEDRVRAIVREELATGRERDPMAAWLAALPPGTRGTATELLAAYAGAHGGNAGPWTAYGLARRLRRTPGVAWRWDHGGRSVYVVG